MLAFLFGFFIFLFVGVGIFKVFGAKSVGKAIFKTILMLVGQFVVPILMLLIAWKLLTSVGVNTIRGVIVLFVIVAILVIIGVVVKFFGGKSVAKFILFVLGIIVFIAIVIGVVAFFAKSFLGFS